MLFHMEMEVLHPISLVHVADPEEFPSTFLLEVKLYPGSEDQQREDAKHSGATGDREGPACATRIVCVVFNCCGPFKLPAFVINEVLPRSVVKACKIKLPQAP